MTRMGAAEAFVQGWRRVWDARAAVAGVALAGVALAALLDTPGALAPPARTTALGAGAASSLLDGVTAATLVHLLVSLALVGALLARLWAGPSLRLTGAVDAGVRRVFRMLRLAALPAATLALVAWLAPPQFGLVAALVLWAVALPVHYAEVRIVAEDRRVVLGALLASARFLRAHPAATFGLHAVYGTLAAAAWMAAEALAPASGPAWGERLAAAWPYLPLALTRAAWAGSEMALFDAHLGRGQDTPPPGGDRHAA